VAFHAVRDLGQFLLRVLQKMWSGAVGLERCVIFILFIDEESARFGFVPMDLVHGTAGFFAGVFGQLLEE
jgi:hypothetical protein